MTKWLAGAAVNRDFSLKLEYISGLALNNKEADAIYANMTAGRTIPAGNHRGAAPASSGARPPHRRRQRFALSGRRQPRR